MARVAAQLEVAFNATGTEETAAKARQMGQIVDDVGKKGGLLGNALGVGIGVIGAGAITKGLGLLKGFGGGILSAAGDAEQMHLALETVTGSQEKANALFGDLQKFAKDTPFEFPEIAQASINLESFGLKTQDWIGTIGDTAAGMGKSVDQVTQAVLDAQTGSYERLKELGVSTAVEGDKLTFRYMKNGEQITETVDKNNQEIINSTLQAIWNDKYAGAMEKQSQSFNGQMSTLSDNWNMRLQKMTLGVFEFSKGAIAQANKFFDDWAEAEANGLGMFDAGLHALNLTLEDVLGPKAGNLAFEGLNLLVSGFRAGAKGISHFITDGLLPVGKGIADFLVDTKTLYDSIRNPLGQNFGFNLDMDIKRLGKIDALSKALGIQFKKLTGINADKWFERMGDATKRPLEAFDKIWGGLKDRNWDQVISGVADGIASVPKFIGDAFKGVDTRFDSLDRVIHTTGKLFTDFGRIIQEIGQGDIDGLMEVLDRTLTHLGDLGTQVVGIAIDVVPEIVGWLADIGGDVWGWVKGKILGTGGVGGSSVDAAYAGAAGYHTAPRPEGDIIDVGKALISFGVDIVGDIWDGAGDLWGWVKRKITGTTTVGDGTGGPEFDRTVPLGSWFLDTAEPTVLGWITGGASALHDFLEGKIFGGGSGDPNSGSPGSVRAGGLGSQGFQFDIAQIGLNVLDAVANLDQETVNTAIQNELDFVKTLGSETYEWAIVLGLVPTVQWGTNDNNGSSDPARGGDDGNDGIIGKYLEDWFGGQTWYEDLKLVLNYEPTQEDSQRLRESIGPWLDELFGNFTEWDTYTGIVSTLAGGIWELFGGPIFMGQMRALGSPFGALKGVVGGWIHEAFTDISTVFGTNGSQDPAMGFGQVEDPLGIGDLIKGVVPDSISLPDISIDGGFKVVEGFAAKAANAIADAAGWVWDHGGSFLWHLVVTTDTTINDGRPPFDFKKEQQDANDARHFLVNTGNFDPNTLNTNVWGSGDMYTGGTIEGAGSPEPAGFVSQGVIDRLGNRGNTGGRAADFLSGQTSGGRGEAFASGGDSVPAPSTAAFDKVLSESKSKLAAFAKEEVKAKLGADSGPLTKTLGTATKIGVAWNNAKFERAAFGGDPTGADKASQTAWTLGNTWNGSVHTGWFAGNESDAQAASDAAWDLGNDWAGSVFTARLTVDTSSLEDAKRAIDDFVQYASDRLPHSPAKTGPLARPISFSYIADDLQSTMDRMAPLAERGMAGVAGAFDKAGFPAMPAGAGAPANTTVVQHLYQVTPPALVDLMRNAEAGGRVGKGLARELQLRRRATS